MNQGADPDRRQVTWLTIVIFCLGYAILLGAELWLIVGTSASLIGSASALLLNLIATLTLAAVIFTIFTRKNIALPTARDIAKEVRSMAVSEGLKDAELREKGLADFYPSFRNVPWPDLISSAKHIDIAVYYFDSWVKANWESLVSFFERGGTVNLFLPDPAESAELARITAFFPEYSQQVVREKIENTSTRFKEALEASRSQSAKVNTTHLKRPPTYSAIRIDREKVVLSIYENYRKAKIDSSAILIDLTKDRQLAQYWDKEFGGMSQ